MCRQTIADGSALERFRKLVQAQGGDPRAIDDPARLPAARRKIVLKSSPSAASSRRSRAGRSATRPCCWARAGPAWTAAIDPAVGVILHKKVGSEVASRRATVYVVRQRRIAARGGDDADQGCVPRSAQSRSSPRRSSSNESPASPAGSRCVPAAGRHAVDRPA